MAFVKDIIRNTITICLENMLSDDYKWTWTVSEGLIPYGIEEYWNPVTYDDLRTVKCLLLKVSTFRTGWATVECRYSKERMPDEEASRVSINFFVDWDLSIKNCELRQGPGEYYGLEQKNPKELEYSWSYCPSAGPDHWINQKTVMLPPFLQRTNKPEEHNDNSYRRPHVCGESVSETYIIKAKNQGEGIITFTYYKHHNCPVEVVKYYVSAQSNLILHIDAVLRYRLSTSSQ